MLTEHVLSVATTGRYLVRQGSLAGLLVGFHGYGENAERHLAELEKLPGVGDWTLVAVQGLHAFYDRKSGEVVASWMTKQHRERSVADNLAFVRSVLEQLVPVKPFVFAGFSQGAAMAYRAAAAFRCDGLLILGGDVPPDVSAQPGVHLPHVLVGRGVRDDWYSKEKFEKDFSFLQSVTRVETCVFDAGHEWTDAFRHAAGKFLRSLSDER